MPRSARPQPPSTPLAPSGPLQQARSTLEAAAPAAAAILSTSVRDDSVSREQVASANSILNRVGLREDAPRSSDTTASDVAYGAFRALLAHLGLPVDALTRSAPADAPIPIAAESVPVPPVNEKQSGPVAPAGRVRASHAPKGRSPSRHADSDFMEALNAEALPTPDVSGDEGAVDR